MKKKEEKKKEEKEKAENETFQQQYKIKFFSQCQNLFFFPPVVRGRGFESHQRFFSFALKWGHLRTFLFWYSRSFFLVVIMKLWILFVVLSFLVFRAELDIPTIDQFQG